MRRSDNKPAGKRPKVQGEIRLGPKQSGGISEVRELRDCGGETGIRTLETVSRLHTFQACAFDHSATSPCGRYLDYRLGICKARLERFFRFAERVAKPVKARPRPRLTGQPRSSRSAWMRAQTPVPRCPGRDPPHARFRDCAARRRVGQTGFRYLLRQTGG